MQKRKSLRKLFIISATVLLALILACAAIIIYVRSVARPHILTVSEINDTAASDCIIVLGAGVRPDGTPSLMLQDRLNMAIQLYENGISQKILMSGDHSTKQYDEVNPMKQWAMDNGISSEDVFTDHAGFSTYESMYRAKEVFQVKSAVIVTQKYHLYRAVYIAEKLGLDVYGVAAEDISYSNQWYRDLRELFATVKDFFYVLFNADPTFLGDAIPIWGDGNLSNG